MMQPVHNYIQVIRSKNNRGFTLVESLVSLAVLIVFTSGVYGGIQLVSQVVYQSRLRILQSSVLNEQIEIIRNMSFFDIGIVNGAPAGLLQRTVTVTKNNIDFIITRTVRNIDDPFDGTIDAIPITPPDGKVYVCSTGTTLLIDEAEFDTYIAAGSEAGPCSGSPEAGRFDQSPADYKFVEVSVRCINCKQQQPISMSTYVGPRFLEGNPDNGALFIEVIDASGRPVQGATVRIMSTSTNPIYDFEDTTGNDGMLRIVDIAPGQNAYQIMVSKDGYTTDMTVSTLENPVKPPASVVSQSVTSRTFTIDLVSQIQVLATDERCLPLSNTAINITGERILATNPDVFVVNSSNNTDIIGRYTFTNIPWDSYTVIPASLDLIGAIPMLPLTVIPGAEVDVQLLFGPNTPHSLLVHVQDTANGDPISSATVEILQGAQTQSAITGIGTIRQVDWSGGAGQELYIAETQYAADNGNVIADSDVRLTDIVGVYPSAGWLESSTFDLGEITNFVSLGVSPMSQPIETGTSSVRLQFASSNSSTPSTWNFLGPDGTSSTFYTAINQNIADIHNGERYARYRLYLSTMDTTITPTVSDITFSFVSACTPPGQAYFSTLSEETYTIVVTADGYQAYSSEIDISGDVRLVVSLTSE